MEFTGSATFASVFNSTDMAFYVGNVAEQRTVLVKDAFTGSFGNISTGGTKLRALEWTQQNIPSTLTFTAAAGQSVFGGGGNDRSIVGR